MIFINYYLLQKQQYKEEDTKYIEDIEKKNLKYET